MKTIKTLLFSLVLAVLALPVHAEITQNNAKNVWKEMMGGWSGVYSELYQKLNPDKNYLVWSIIAPKVPLSFRRTDDFREFIQHVSSKSISISHNLVGWKCTLPNGERVMGATGMSGEQSGQAQKMVKGGFGLTTFLATYHDGWMSGAEATANIWSKRGKKEEIYNLVVEITPEQCGSMLNFAKKFVLSSSKPYKKFGLTLKPAKFEGGGCISFAAEMLKKAGVFSSVLKASERSLWANHYRFGGNDLPLPSKTTVPRLSWREGLAPKKVGINTFFSDTWNAGQKGVNLKMLDPELMIWGLKNLDSRIGTPRKVMDYPEQCERGEYCGPKSVRIDNSFDAQTRKVGSLAKSWKNSMLSNGYDYKLIQLQGHPFMIFSR